MLYYNIIDAFAARGIKYIHPVLTEAGISDHDATNICNGNTATICLCDLEKICKMLNCTPNDLIVFKPDRNSIISSGHRLNKLIKNSFEEAAYQLQKLSFEEMRILANERKENNLQVTDSQKTVAA